MRRTALMSRAVLASCIAAAAVGVMGASRPAGAAMISSIHYDITGGMFGGVLFDGYFGPITGVSVTYTPPGGSVSTPYYCIGAAACGRLDFTFTGPSITPSASTMLYLDVDTAYIDSIYFHANYTFTFSGLPYPTLWWAIHATAGVGSGHTGWESYPTTLATIYTIGNEVRVLPEPPTHVALVFGVVLLGALAILRTRRRTQTL